MKNLYHLLCSLNTIFTIMFLIQEVTLPKAVSYMRMKLEAEITTGLGNTEWWFLLLFLPALRMQVFICQYFTAII